MKKLLKKATVIILSAALFMGAAPHMAMQMLLQKRHPKPA